MSLVNNLPRYIKIIAITIIIMTGLVAILGVW